jgi:DNA-binding SARP family transcriptional activator
MAPQFRFLGSTYVSGGPTDIKPAMPLRRGLLAALALHPGHAVSYATLAEILWDSPPNSARSNLRNRLSELRTDLAAALPDLHLRLEAHRSANGMGGAVVLHTARQEVDVLHMEDLVKQAWSAIRSGGAEAVETADSALVMWRGPFGVDLPETAWFAERALGAKRVFVEANLAATAAEIRFGDPLSAVPRLESMPSRLCGGERWWRLYISAFAVTGQPKRALAEVQRCRADYMDEGLDLPREVSLLQKAILEQDETAVRGMVADM